MDQYPKNNRSYSEKELRVLIQRATKMYEESSGESDRNLSFDEIQHIASELGLPKEYINRAALELEHQPDSKSGYRLFGGPYFFDLTRVIDGNISEEQWGHTVSEFRRFTGRSGQVSDVGGFREWTHKIGESDEGISFTRTQITTRPSGDQTTIQIHNRFGGLAFGYIPVAIFTIIISLIAINEYPNPVTLILSLTGVLGSLTAVRFSIQKWAKLRKKKLAKLIDSIFPQKGVTSPTDAIKQSNKDVIDIPEQETNSSESVDSNSHQKSTSKKSRT